MRSIQKMKNVKEDQKWLHLKYCRRGYIILHFSFFSSPFMIFVWNRHLFQNYFVFFGWWLCVCIAFNRFLFSLSLIFFFFRNSWLLSRSFLSPQWTRVCFLLLFLILIYLLNFYFVSSFFSASSMFNVRARVHVLVIFTKNIHIGIIITLNS